MNPVCGSKRRINHAILVSPFALAILFIIKFRNRYFYNDLDDKLRVHAISLNKNYRQ